MEQICKPCYWIFVSFFALNCLCPTDLASHNQNKKIGIDSRFNTSQKERLQFLFSHGSSWSCVQKLARQKKRILTWWSVLLDLDTPVRWFNRRKKHGIRDKLLTKFVKPSRRSLVEIHFILKIICSEMWVIDRHGAKNREMCNARQYFWTSIKIRSKNLIGWCLRTLSVKFSTRRGFSQSPLH